MHVLDDRTLVIPERPGNKRADGWVNVLSNPHVGLIFVVPGRTDTLRVNGRARLVRDGAVLRRPGRARAPAAARPGRRDRAGFHHCGKAFLRSRLWDPESWNPDGCPPRGHRAELERPRPTGRAGRYYGPAYAERLYRQT